MSVALPAPPEAVEPSQAPGRASGRVALLVATRSDGSLRHVRFEDLPRFLSPGDLLVVNTSATLPAALAARLAGRPLELHVSTPLGTGRWVVELRTRERQPVYRPPIGSRIDLPARARAVLLGRYRGSDRLSVARLELDEPLADYLHRHGHPIRYPASPQGRPLEAYQTVFALDPGSAEMPSAGRAFTPELVTQLVSRGVLIAPVTLHAGVSSLDAGEPPYPERYRVPPTTARLVNAVRSWGGRVIAVGTTVVRALETVAGRDGAVRPGEGTTELVVTPARGLRVVDGVLSGWHEPESSHLELLEAAAGPKLLDRCYDAARAAGYVWHEFGDLSLILP